MRRGVIFALLCFAALAGAAPPEYSPSLTRFRRLDTEDGLSQASAWALVQDVRGFLWIGTQDGLNRFDGSEFRHYRRRDDQPASLAGNQVQSLLLDAEGRLWVGGNGGLSRYREDSDDFTHVSIADARGDADGVRTLHQDGSGTIWVAGYGGLGRVEPDAAGRSGWNFDPDNAPPDVRFESLASDSRGRLWLGSLAGVSRLDPSTGRVDVPFAGLPGAEALASARIDALLVDREGVVWIGAVGRGLFRFDEAAGELRRFRHDEADTDSLDSDLIRSLLQDRDGRLWIGTRAGLNLMPEPAAAEARFIRFAHHRPDEHSLGAGRVLSLLQTTDGVLLAGTYTGGVSVLDPGGERFSSFTPDRVATAALRDPVIYTLAAAGPDALWLGGRNGLYRFFPDRGELQDFPASEGLGVSGISVVGDELWLGVLAGAKRFDPERGSLAEAPLPAPPDGLHITRLWFEPEFVLAGTYDRGVYLVRRNDGALLAHVPVASWVSHIEAFDDQMLLVCASDGLHWIARDGSGERYLHQSSGAPGAPLPAGGITYFLRSADGALWLASSRAGLLRMRLERPGDPASARFEAFQVFQEAGLQVVQAIAEDDAGWLWLSTSHGIARFDPQSGALDRFGAADGAFDSDYQSASVARLADGRIAFSATRGVTLFDPRQVVARRPPPPPVLTELRLWNRRIDPQPRRAGATLRAPLHLTRAISVPAAEARMLGLRFSSPDLLSPERLRYAYRLQGFDPDWIETGASERSATYTNLGPGRYRFEVKAGESSQLDSAEATVLDIEILPPWWQTWWVRSLFALAVVAGVHATYRWRLHRIEANRELLRSQVAERTEQLSQAKQRAERALDELRTAQRGLIEAEKMASLGGLVVGVAHEINTPLGVAVTASSLLGERAGSVRRAFEAGELKRSDLAAFLDTARDASAMVDRSLERAAQLVNSFKQVSVDQGSDERRRFELGDYLRTLLRSLQPGWKRRPIRFELELEPGLDLDTYPGAIAQAVGQLVQNALTHAFAEGEGGTLRLTARALGDDRVELVLEDDGRGIPPEALPHVFEPFYTTRRGRGGTGLGLHIVYNLVTVRLGGQIAVQSEGRGTRVVLDFPRRAH